MKVKSLSHVRLPATPWTAAYQAPPSMGSSRQEHWSGAPLPSPLKSCQLFVTAWTAACQASPSFAISWSLLKFMSIELMMPSNHLILCHPLLLPPQSFPASGSFQLSQLFTSGGQSVGVSDSTSVLPMNIQD